MLVDSIGGQMPRFQIYPIAHNDDAVEGQPRLGAVPGNKLIDCVLVNATDAGDPRLLSTAVLQ